MEIKPSIGKYIVYASDYCLLDSHVMDGGGTNETAKIQAILDKAKEWGMLHLIMDGAALISGIRVHSNTTIECLNNTCGFFMEAGSDDAVIRNAEFSKTEYTAVNVTLKGGTYNHNGANQAMCFPEEDQLPKGDGCSEMLVPFKFFGVQNFKMIDVSIVDQRRYALLMGNWEDVYMENVRIPLPHLLKETNQDGLHFHGPGKNLVLKNISGHGGDDFIAINTDEGDNVSSISDVEIDGVFLDGACQAVRLLCRDQGILENVSIRNVHGTVDSFGFYINPWWHEMIPGVTRPSGKFRNISIENIDVTMTNPLYDYNPQALFYLGGDIENIRFRNIAVRADQPDFRLLAIREGDGTLWEERAGHFPTHIQDVFMDNVFIAPVKEDIKFEKPFAVECLADDAVHVDRITLNNITAKNGNPEKALLTIEDTTRVKEVNMNGIRLEGFGEATKGKCEALNAFDVQIA